MEIFKTICAVHRMEIKMLESMGNMRRTNYCGTLRIENKGENITVAGSIAKSRNKGGVIFADLRDTSGILQLIFDDSTDKAVFEKAQKLKSEFVVIASGILREREAKTNKIQTGDVELYVSELRILSEAQTTPFEIRDEVKVNDELRLQYRYLDLRRPSMHSPIIMRSKIAKVVRDYFDENFFVEIETPMLIKSTPEGARDYLVPSRIQPGHFYALPQSPQIYKQILMLSGFDRYYQLARCFRDEDLRADRQPEFTQIDIEMAFVDENDVMMIKENLCRRLWKDILNIELPTDIPRLTYDEAMSRFGSDKPDMRYEYELQDITDILSNSDFVVFKGAIENGGSVKCINAKGFADILTRKEIDKLVDVAKLYGAKGLAYSRITADNTSSSFEKFLSEQEKENLYTKMGAEVGDVLLIVADGNTNKACTALGQVRIAMANKCGLINDTEYKFLWVTEFPFFEYNEETGKFDAMHHPFTMPKESHLNLIETNPGAVRARAYDLVLNGCELGSGSIRINNPELQERMFKALGIDEEYAEECFGFLKNAYKYGAPPHGGMALGFDRIVMLMLNCTMREAIAFPKVQNASELMSGAPQKVENTQLKDLQIKMDYSK